MPEPFKRHTKISIQIYLNLPRIKITIRFEAEEFIKATKIQLIFYMNKCEKGTIESKLTNKKLQLLKMKTFYPFIRIKRVGHFAADLWYLNPKGENVGYGVGQYFIVCNIEAYVQINPKIVDSKPGPQFHLQPPRQHVPDAMRASTPISIDLE